MKVTKKVKNLIVSVVIATGIIFSSGTAVLAQQSNYSCGAYGASGYSNNTCSDGKSENGLSGTGQAALPYVLAGVLCIAGGVGLFLLSRKSRKK